MDHVRYHLLVAALAVASVLAAPAALAQNAGNGGGPQVAPCAGTDGLSVVFRCDQRLDELRARRGMAATPPASADLRPGDDIVWSDLFDPLRSDTRIPDALPRLAIEAIAVNDQGEFYLGGIFSFLDTPEGRMQVNGVARWDGAQWHALGDGIDGHVLALAAGGGDVFVGGFVSTAGGEPVGNIARWDGSGWHPLGSGLNGPARTMLFHEGDLYVAGDFTTAGGTSVNRLARWDGTAWQAVGGGANSGVYALASDGQDLYAGGFFTNIGGVSANRIARWDGAQWHPIGSGVNDVVYSLALDGDDLYAGGSFTQAGGEAATNVAHWDGSAWHAMGGDLNNTVSSLTLFEGEVYAGGWFRKAFGSPFDYIARWDGTSWQAVGTGLDSGVWSSVVYDGHLYPVGMYADASAVPTRFARWDGSAWSDPSGTDFYGNRNTEVYAMVRSPEHGLLAGGYLHADEGRFVVGWDGGGWHAPLGTGTGYLVTAIAPLGNDVVVGGWFGEAGGVNALGVARWSGSAWDDMGLQLNSSVEALAVSGERVTMGGYFGSPGLYVTQWEDGDLLPMPGMNDAVNALAVVGEDVYAGGWFTTAGGTPRPRIARWNGQSWQALGSGLNGPVWAFATHESDLYVGGDFTTAGGIPAGGIARWDGEAWHALDEGVNGSIEAIAVVDGHVIVGGIFTEAGGVPARNLARWDGTQWHEFGGGADGNFVSMLYYDEATETLYVSGRFDHVGEQPSWHFAAGQPQLPSTDVEEQTAQLLPSSTVYPNPFRTSATVELRLGEAQPVRVEVFDVLGRRVGVLHEGELGAGPHRLTVDGRGLAPGPYLVRATMGALSQTRKLVLMR